MFTKTNLISTLVTGLWAYFGGYVLWNMIGGTILDSHRGTVTGLMKNPPELIFEVIGCIILAFAFSTIYSLLAKSAKGLSKGIPLGLLMGILIGFGDEFITFAYSNEVDHVGIFIKGGLNIVFFVIMGILANLVYKKVGAAE